MSVKHLLDKHFKLFTDNTLLFYYVIIRRNYLAILRCHFTASRHHKYTNFCTLI